MNKKSYIVSICTGLSMYLNVMGKEDDFICASCPSDAQIIFSSLIFFDAEKITAPNSIQVIMQRLSLTQKVETLSIQSFQKEMLDLQSQKQNQIDFKNKTSKEIFEKIFLKTNNYFGYIRNDCSHSDQNCAISESDQEVVERIISENPKDKSVLFIGFDQNQPTEGSEIYFDTPGYTRSIFWSNWYDRPDKNHNSIKFCFCKINEFLEKNPKLINFFDYVIIGCQTREYITPDAWIALVALFIVIKVKKQMNIAGILPF